MEKERYNSTLACTCSTRTVLYGVINICRISNILMALWAVCACRLEVNCRSPMAAPRVRIPAGILFKNRSDEFLFRKIPFAVMVFLVSYSIAARVRVVRMHDAEMGCRPLFVPGTRSHLTAREAGPWHLCRTRCNCGPAPCAPGWCRWRGERWACAAGDACADAGTLDWAYAAA